VEQSPWAWEPAWIEVGAVLALAGAFALSDRRSPRSRARRLAFAAASLLLLAVVATPLETLATEYLLSAHLLQNVTLAEWAPALVVLGIPTAAAAALARSRPVRFLTRPLVALPLWLAVYVAWHAPAAYDAALRHPSSLLPVEHACYFLAGLALWWPVFHAEPWPLRPSHKAAYLFAAFLAASPIGLALAFLPSPIYDFYETAARIWELSALRDQQIAGMLMSVAEAVVFLGLFAYFFLRFLAEEDQAQAPASPS
jgi:cytochrome c oxidase assembly factor CtaG